MPRKKIKNPKSGPANGGKAQRGGRTATKQRPTKESVKKSAPRVKGQQGGAGKGKARRGEKGRDRDRPIEDAKS